MLAPLRDYLRPKDPKSSALLCTTKKSYFVQLSVGPEPSEPAYGEARWIRLEDLNVEHLLDFFTTIDANSGDIWDSCNDFMRHLYRHKKRQTVLKQKIEGLPDDHRSKPQCLFQLALLSRSVGNPMERKRLLTRVLALEGAGSLMELLSCYQQCRLGEAASEALCALEIFEKFGAARAMGDCGDLLRSVETGLQMPGESGSSGERPSFWKQYLHFSTLFSA